MTVISPLETSGMSVLGSNRNLFANDLTSFKEIESTTTEITQVVTQMMRNSLRRIGPWKISDFFYLQITSVCSSERSKLLAFVVSLHYTKYLCMSS